MSRLLTFSAGFAAGYAVAAGRGAVAGGPSAPSTALRPAVQRWTGSLTAAASAVSGGARSAGRRALATVGVAPGRQGAAASGGVIPLSAVPIDELSDWELDLLTTPEASP